VPDGMLQVLSSGPPGAKVNIAVLGDGFTSGEQAVYDDKVRELLLDGVFAHDYFYEDAQAFNLYQVNLVSRESGVTRRVYKEAGAGASTELVDTALGWVYNGSAERGWVEHGPGTAAAMRRALDAWVPDHHLVVVILNEPAFGGCGGGGLQVVTLGVAWTALAHELGHAVGGLADECCQSRPWPAGEPGAVNLTTSTSRTGLKWGRFVAPSTPVPTGIGTCAGYNRGVPPAGWDPSQDVGVFEGGGGHGMGVFRPVLDCRMRSDDQPWCPVCYTELKTRHQPRTGHSFRNCHAGDFDGDGRDELYVFNGVDWSMAHLLMVSSTGSGLDFTERYDGNVPGWQMRRHDRHWVADCNGDGRADLFVHNDEDWGYEYLGAMISNSKELNATRRQDWVGEWSLGPDDRFLPCNYQGGTGTPDLVVTAPTGSA
jgi:IgA Peptidase M64/FG-GAP-like repeat